MSFYKGTWAGLVLLATMASQPTHAACVRHFYNRSNFQWSIAGYDGSKSSLIIAPNTTIEIPWGSATIVTISGNIPGRPYVRQFQVQAADDCVLIAHEGNTGNVTVNKPTNGDVATCVGGC